MARRHQSFGTKYIGNISDLILPTVEINPRLRRNFGALAEFLDVLKALFLRQQLTDFVFSLIKTGSLECALILKFDNVPTSRGLDRRGHKTAFIQINHHIGNRRQDLRW